MKFVSKLLNKSFILYVVFGLLTTAVNMLVYQVCYENLNLSNVGSTAVAWVFAVSFAYITNRKWVFESKASSSKEVVKEVISFFICRLATGFLDVGIMYVSVDILKWHALLMKFVSNVLVIMINYVASKLFIFKSK